MMGATGARGLGALSIAARVGFGDTGSSMLAPLGSRGRPLDVRIRAESATDCSLPRPFNNGQRLAHFPAGVTGREPCARAQLLDETLLISTGRCGPSDVATRRPASRRSWASPSRGGIQDVATGAVERRTATETGGPAPRSGSVTSVNTTSREASSFAALPVPVRGNSLSECRSISSIRLRSNES